jgi:asparagine synthase (glutamine-hydrolysing)
VFEPFRLHASQKQNQRMPGLTGIIAPGSRVDYTETVRAMLDCMTRTSDSVSGSFNHAALGVWSGWDCTNGTFTDCLPIWNETRDVCLLFSGECFGLEQEIKRLGQKQAPFKPSDASYLVHLYEEEGEAFICKLNGFFAGVLIDLRSQRILLFNDRYGLGRLYVHEAGGCVFFASEAKSLLAVLPGLRRVDPRALGEWFSCGCVLQDRTLFQGVSLLPAGSCWVFTADGKVSKRKYFDPAAWESQPRLTEADYYDRLKELFPQILNRYFQGRSRIGMSLTGGLDGRMIMAWSPAGPGEMPCYTFNGPFRDCADVRIARRVAGACRQPHQVIPLGKEFFAAFPALAENAIRITDGAMDVTGAAELYVNQLARQIAPVRLTGSYGSEVLRDNLAFRPSRTRTAILGPDLAGFFEDAARTYDREMGNHRRSFITFKQVPWHHFGRFALERSQLQVRSPYLDNDLVALAFRVPPGLESSLAPALRLVAEGNPDLGRIPTDRGITFPAGHAPNKLRRSWAEFLAKAEYAYDYGMPQWLARADHLLAPLKLERLFLGNQKFCHFRLWYRRELSGFVREILLDRRTLDRPFLNRRRVEQIVSSHLAGTANHTVAIHQLLSCELLHRSLIEQN